MKQSPLKTHKPVHSKAPKMKVKSPGKALAVKPPATATTAHLPLLPSALAIDTTASKSSLTKRITTLPSCTTTTTTSSSIGTGSSSAITRDSIVEAVTTPLAPGTGTCSGSPAPCATTPPTTTTTTTTATRSVWYLGGNQIIKLLTSVDGDLDHAVLANIADVPSVVGDLALSVESLVSDDFTVGGFETDLLAKIAANTLAAKRASVVTSSTNTTTTVPVQPQQHQLSLVDGSDHEQQQQQQHQLLQLASDDPMTTDEPFEQDPPSQQQPPQLMTFDSVPNPLADYQPVPNPLARITPPPSPLITIEDNKPTEVVVVAIPPPTATTTTTTAPMIHAR